MVASAAARIWRPQAAGNAETAPHGTLVITMPAPSMPITRGRRSCQASSAPICAAAHSSSVAQAAWPGRKAAPMEKYSTAAAGQGEGGCGGSQ